MQGRQPPYAPPLLRSLGFGFMRASMEFPFIVVGAREEGEGEGEA